MKIVKIELKPPTLPARWISYDDYDGGCKSKFMDQTQDIISWQEPGYSVYLHSFQLQLRRVWMYVAWPNLLQFPLDPSIFLDLLGPQTQLAVLPANKSPAGWPKIVVAELSAGGWSVGPTCATWASNVRCPRDSVATDSKTHIPRAQSKHLDPMLNLKSQSSFVFRLNWSCSTYHQFLGRSVCEVLVSMGIPKWEWLICNVIIDCPWLSNGWRYCISYLRAYGWKNFSWCHVPLLQCRQHASPFCGQVALFLCDLSQEVCKLLHQSSKTGSKHRDAKYSTSSLVESCAIFPLYKYFHIGIYI